MRSELARSGDVAAVRLAPSDQPSARSTKATDQDVGTAALLAATEIAALDEFASSFQSVKLRVGTRDALFEHPHQVRIVEHRSQL